MRVRSFFYVCAGLFLLAAAFQVGVRSAGAQSGIHSTSGIAFQSGGDVLTEAGEVFQILPNLPSGVFDGTYSWQRVPELDPHVPLPSIAWWSGGVFTDIYGTVWVNYFEPESHSWYSMPQLPGTVSVDPATMGEVKAKFK